MKLPFRLNYFPPSNRPLGASFRSVQTGFTMIEVVVSMFILALGIMALVGMQNRTLGSIRQGENIERVSQAVENLAEGMRINPYLRVKITPKGYLTNRDYGNYLPFSGCTGQEVEWVNIGSDLDQKQLAQRQIKQFCKEIRQIEGIDPKEIQIKICTHSSLEGNLPWNFSCKANGSETILKVVWKFQTNMETQGSTPPRGRSPLVDAENKITLSYEVPIIEE
ncbi:MAG: type IV pilus modification protein PilV [Neisseriaceae bacterium]